MKYELHYATQKPTERQVLDMVLAVNAVTGDECESVELIHDTECAPLTAYLIPQEPNDEAWKQ